MVRRGGYLACLMANRHIGSALVLCPRGFEHCLNVGASFLPGSHQEFFL